MSDNGAPHNGTNGNKIRGRIKSLKKNYGFIGGADGNDYFFYWTFLSKSTKTMNQLSVGTTVEFKAEEFEKKLRAQDIVAVD